MPRTLTSYEQDTIINFNKDERIVYTFPIVKEVEQC